MVNGYVNSIVANGGSFICNDSLGQTWTNSSILNAESGQLPLYFCADYTGHAQIMLTPAMSPGSSYL
jgi:hypothetical protein